MAPILLLLDSSGIGGIETHVAVLAETLRAAGHEARIVFLADHGENPFHVQLRARSLPFVVLKGGLFGLLRYLHTENPALLHCHGYKAGILGRIAARLNRVPVVTTFHAGERAPLPVGLYQQLDLWTSFLGERIAVSPQIADSLPFRTTHMPNFIPVPPLSPRPPRVPRIGFVGRLSHEKAPDRFCAMVRDLGEHAECHVYGDGPMREELERMAAGRIRFHGFVTHMAAIWRELDLLIMPSRAEGLPMAALEAAAQGLPLIAGDVGALPTVIRDGESGYLLRGKDDAEVIARGREAITRFLALDHAARARLSQVAHAHVAAHFGADAALPALLAVYRRSGYPG